MAMAYSNDDTSHYEGVLLVEINERLKGIQEGQDALVDVPTRLTNIEDHIFEIKTDIKAIKAVITNQSGQIDNHAQRITSLEHVTA